MNATARIVKRLRAAADLAAEVDKLEAEVRASRSRKQSKSTPSRKEVRREERRAQRSNVRAAVEHREEGRCAIPGCPHDHRLELDHFWGRGREEGIDSCWMLCPEHHRQKTLNRPNRREWLVAFVNHASRHGYTAQAEKGHKAIALERAQHPEAK